MEEAIRYRIELIKRSMNDYAAELAKEMDDRTKAWIHGRIAGLEHEMNTLENLLLSWEEYQKYGNCIPF
ncbi:hypothetical protein H839_08069 [Parageobacillus genomosp. 1]|uniref:Phage protein n=1 Tax=Parageobacillus genomosp. 1 TaxID=1295642 RepID=A0ABC9VGL3_9BACL|nr:hypothetical protein [Parageobacillus genomosp. 1]EZP77573.1 hypothetical protein H839_08069 [Parageobacillus genomosp. 1]